MGDLSSWDQLGAGDLLGSYRIVERLSDGGMALLYVGRHLRIQREAAIKVLRPEFASRAREVRRFLEEARAIGEIHHPGIVSVYDFVEEMDREPPLIYMVMELLRGQTLAERIDQGPLDPGQAIALGSQVADALAAVHRARLLHRDLKASNIFLVEGGKLQVKLLDFGLTLPFGERQKLNLTDPGTTMGTPEYMSPEHIMGHELDNRSDVYMLGVVLYEALCGTRPFVGDRVGELLLRQVNELPQPLRERRPDVPEALDAVVLRCLEKEPDRRFQSMRELRLALELGSSLPQGRTQPVSLLRRLGFGRLSPDAPRRWGARRPVGRTKRAGMPQSLGTSSLLALAGPARRAIVPLSVFFLLAGVGIFLGLMYFGRSGSTAPDSRPPVAVTQSDQAALPVSLDAAPPAPPAAGPPDAARPTEPDVALPSDTRPRRRPRRRRDASSNKGLKNNPIAPTIDPWKLKKR